MKKPDARCAAMNLNGKQCRKQATTWEQYHGDSELYGYDGPNPVWVRVAFCDLHKAAP